MTINPLIKVTLILFFLSQSCENKKAKKNLTLQPEIEGMVWIPGGLFEMGAYADDVMALPHEKPKHTVLIDGFFMDVT